MLKHFSDGGDPLLFNCPCGNCDTEVNPKLPEVLDEVRELAGVPMGVSSGPRCVPYNIHIGGAEYSEHIDGDGADIPCSTSRDRFLIIQAAIVCGITRIGVAKTFIHLGISKTNDPLVMWVY
jgi:hypothetical protein